MDWGWVFLQCLKCGEAVTEGNAFCDKCLAGMKNYPIPQDTALILPKRPDYVSRRYGRKKKKSTEELLLEAHQRIKTLRFALIFEVFLILVLALGCLFLLRRDEKPVVGQNYSTTSTSATTGSLPTEG